MERQICEAIKGNGVKCTFKAKTIVDDKHLCGVHSKQSRSLTSNKKNFDPSNPSVMVIQLGEISKEINQIASFDLDHTIIKPIKGKFIESIDDWKFCEFFDKTIFDELIKSNFHIVIFTNQQGVEAGKISYETLKQRLTSVARKLDVPVTIFAATCKDKYRKPYPTMWTKCLDTLNISMNSRNKLVSRSFYCGDAAGRFKAWRPGAGKDFSCSDRKFAHNIGIKFVTPEEFFMHKKPPDDFEWYDPQQLFIEAKKGVYHEIGPREIQEVVVLVGSPASGKSTLAGCFVSKDYIHISRDIEGTMKKCLKSMEEALDNNFSVIIDNTNRSITDRKQWICAAKERGLPVRCVWLNISKDLVFHLNAARILNPQQGRKKNVANVVIHTFFKYLEEPTIVEGFDEVTQWWDLKFDGNILPLYLTYVY